MIQYRKNTSEGSKKCSQKVDIDKISKKTSIIIGYLKKYQLGSMSGVFTSIFMQEL
jgi:hypothetical protein